MALVPTQATHSARRWGPRPPARLSPTDRRRVRSTIGAALADLEGDAVLLAGSITDAIAALGAGLWTPAHGTRPWTSAPLGRRVADEIGLTLHTVPAWHLPEGREIAREQLDVASEGDRERAARLAATAAAARRQGADRVIAGAGAEAYGRGLSLARARRCVERYGVQLVTPFADRDVQALGAQLDDALLCGRWRGRCWPAWALREAFACRLTASLAWPMRGLGTADGA